MDIGACTPEYTSIMMSMPTQPNLMVFRYVIGVAASVLLPVLDPKPAALAFGAGGGWD